MRRSGHLRSLFLIAAVVAGLYARTVDDEWHLDDAGERDWPGVAAASSPIRERADYRGTLPLVFWKLDNFLSGDTGISHHLTNNAIHAVNAALLYAIVWILAARWGRGRRLAALTAALVFAAHPLASQTVAYVTQRSTSLAAACVLGATLGWIAFVREPRARRWGWLGLAAAFTLAGASSKHVALLAPAFAGLTGVLVPRAGTRRRILLAFCVLPALLLPRALDLSSRASRHMRDAAAAPAQPPPQGAARIFLRPPPRDYALTQVGVVATYARMAVLPTGLNLDHDVRFVRTPWTAAVLLPALLHLALLAAAIRLRRAEPLVAVGIAWFYAGVLPTSSLVPSTDAMFEHRAYLSLAGFALIAAAAIRRVHARGPAAAVVLGTFAVTALGVATACRVGVWDTERSLWTDVVAKSPAKARPYVNLGLALERAGDPAGAERQYRTAVALDPSGAPALTNLGNLLGRRGELAEARAVLRAAMDADPELAAPAFNLANIAMEEGRYAEAESLYRRARDLGLTTPVLESSLAASIALRTGSADT